MREDNKSLVRQLTFVATLGGLLFGYDTAVISGAVGSIDANFIAPQHLAETARDALSGWTVSSALLGCIIGAAMAGWISTAIGRRGGMLVAGALFLISAAGSAYPEIGLGSIGTMGPAALTPFILYRILCGVGVGIASMLAPLYIAEIAPSEIRGRLVSFNQLSIVLGMLLVYFVNWAIASQGDEAWIHATGWRLMLLSEAAPALFFLLLLTRVPDTPRWYAMKGRPDQALAILRRLVGEAEANLTLAEIERSLLAPTRPVAPMNPAESTYTSATAGGDAHVAASSTPLFTFGPLVIVAGILLSVFQQLVGINAVLYYAPLMFSNLGASTATAFWQTVIVGLTNVIFTVIAIATVDRVGRKPLLILGGLIMGVAMVTLGFQFQANSAGIGPLLAAMIYIAGFALSWGPVTWVLLAEMFPNSIKSRALAIAVAAQWIANLFVSWSFKILIGNSTMNALFNHGLPYWIYGLMSFVAAGFVYLYVPETRRRNLEEIQDLWIARHSAPPLPLEQSTVG